MHNRALQALLLAMAVAGLAACSSSGIPMGEQRAGAFVGGALTNFFGLDADDPSVRNTAREIAVGRIYDLTPAGYTIVSGAASSAPGGFGDFGGGNGSVTVNAGMGQSTIELEIASFDPDVGNVVLLGRFNASEAQQAVDSPGASYTIAWDLSWEQDGTVYEVSAEQAVSGTDWN